jgi:hypothetical protein
LALSGRPLSSWEIAHPIKLPKAIFRRDRFGKSLRSKSSES